MALQIFGNSAFCLDILAVCRQAQLTRVPQAGCPHLGQRWLGGPSAALRDLVAVGDLAPSCLVVCCSFLEAG